MTDDPLSLLAVRMEVAFNTKDAAKLASLYTHDASLMPPNQPTVIGRAAIEAWFRAPMSQGGEIRIVAERSVILGDAAYQVGSFARKANDHSDASENRFKYVLLLRRVDGDWKIERDIWNADQL